MKRTQIYIDVETYRQAELLAKVTGKTVSQIIRESLAKHLPTQKKSTTNSFELLRDFSKKYPPLPGTPKDLSSQLDHYLYGTPKRKLKAK